MKRRQATKATRNQKVDVLVCGQVIHVTHTYNPETYEPYGRRSRTPESCSHDREKYRDWGRKHFGEEWLKNRDRMLEKRNIYVNDPDYRHRQRLLRVQEHNIENRPCKPYIQRGLHGQGNLSDKSWQALYRRLSATRPEVEQQCSTKGSPLQSHSDRDSDGCSDGYSTYPPSPSSEPQVDLKLLESQQGLFSWADERDCFEKVFQWESNIDEIRSEREDSEGDKQLEKEQQAIEDLRSHDPLEHTRRKERLQWLRAGWTTSQIDAEERKKAIVARQMDKSIQSQPAPSLTIPLSREEMAAKRRTWTKAGFAKSRQEELIKQFSMYIALSDSEPVTARPQRRKRELSPGDQMTAKRRRSQRQRGEDPKYLMLRENRGGKRPRYEGVLYRRKLN